MSGTPISETLIEALSAAESVDLEGKTVNDYIDLDAIDALACNERSDWDLEFTAGTKRWKSTVRAGLRSGVEGINGRTTDQGPRTEAPKSFGIAGPPAAIQPFDRP